MLIFLKEFETPSIDQDFVTFVGSIFEKYQEKLNEDDGMDSLLEYLGVKSESLEDSEDFLECQIVENLMSKRAFR